MILSALNYSKINLEKAFQKFRLVHIDDVLNANIEAIRSKKKGIHVLNISIKKEYSLYDISKIIQSQLKSKIKIEKIKKDSNPFEPNKVSLNKHFFLLPKKFVPKINLFEIISKQIKKNDEY